MTHRFQQLFSYRGVETISVFQPEAREHFISPSNACEVGLARGARRCEALLDPFHALGVSNSTAERKRAAHDDRCEDGFPSRIRNASQADGDAVSVMRRALASARGPVTIVSVGYMTNLHGLLRSAADAASPLSGVALVEETVERLV